jgi:hypothetical protein
MVKAMLGARVWEKPEPLSENELIQVDMSQIEHIGNSDDEGLDIPLENDGEITGGG